MILNDPNHYFVILEVSSYFWTGETRHFKFGFYHKAHIERLLMLACLVHHYSEIRDLPRPIPKLRPPGQTKV